MPINMNLESTNQTSLSTNAADGIRPPTEGTNQVVDKGREWIGRMTWQAGTAANETDSHFESKLNNTYAFHSPEESSRMNCKEATILIGLSAYADSSQVNEFERELDEAKSDEINYNKTMNKILSFHNAEAKVTPSSGDVLFMFGDAHVALATDENNALSLWHGPSDNNHLQEVSSDQLFDLTRSDAVQYANALKSWLYNSETTLSSDQFHELSNDLYDFIDDVTDERIELTGPIHHEYIQKFDDKLRSFGVNPLDKEVFIRVAKQPFEPLAEKSE
ncbi:hypothetical protein [Spartinivicinus poritis]|uniref:Uncharacterized protein n=1 Tax=Spartinivicinus poritis TaxID=2994640 RepID=A0ABT5UDF1_9GAMM|nr:hypothetical protein [Spartinivicinus sp. A2-2]MDE1464390.1 hypothetical protein [Spartinivicinus sp. A2-2]